MGRSLFAELRRRNVFKAGIAYLALGWVVTQVTSTVAPALHMPDWVVTVVVWIGVIGFPFVIMFSWIYELTPEGLRREGEVDRLASIAHVTGRRIDYLIVGLLAVAIALFAIDRFVLTPQREAAHDASLRAEPSASTNANANSPTAAAPAPGANTAASAASAAAKAAGDSTPIPNKSIAVLPFTDLSPGRDQEYFSDGMAEEILDALAKVKDLKVAGRTSSFSFKGRNEDLRTVGKVLGVANILEGSVRKQGEKVRITAQLIRSGDDFHLWSDSYDGDLSDVFALQERIARAITDKLKVVLEGEQKTRLVPVATVNPEAYTYYLQATAIFDRRDIPRYDEAVKALQEAVKLDPSYARAYARLAAMHVLLGTYTNINLQAAHDALVHYAQTASALDPTLAEPYAALGFSYGKFPGRTIDQRKAFDRALELDADDVTTNFWYGLSLVKTGYTRRGIELIEHALAIDPLYPNGLRWRGILYYYVGDLDRAYQYLKRARDLGLGFADRELAGIAFARGDREQAIRLATIGGQTWLAEMAPEASAAIARGLFGDAADRAAAVSLINTYLAQPHEHIPGFIPDAMARLGEPAAALHAMHTQLSGDTTDFFVLLWNAPGKPMRELPEFPVFLRDFGLIELWDTYGEPDVCRRRAPSVYSCE